MNYSKTLQIIIENSGLLYSLSFLPFFSNSRYTHLLKKGGVVIYHDCSMERKEDER